MLRKPESEFFPLQDADVFWDLRVADFGAGNEWQITITDCGPITATAIPRNVLSLPQFRERNL